MNAKLFPEKKSPERKIKGTKGRWRFMFAGTERKEKNTKKEKYTESFLCVCFVRRVFWLFA